jgi:hypothetical protein
MSVSILETAISERVPDGDVFLPGRIATAVENIKAALALAMAGSSKLDERIVTLPGMSGRRYRMFINHLVSSTADARYMEVGSWTGSTLCSAINGNAVRATAIDNWSQFGGPKDKFMENLERFRTPKAYVNFIEMDFRKVSFEDLGPFNIYLFDGPHSAQDQYDGLKLALPALDDLFVLIVDDWNWPNVRAGTSEAVLKCGLNTHYSVELRTTLDDSHAQVHAQNSDWHNGYFIAVLSKA